MTLTHNGGPEWADSALNRDGTIVHEPTKGGLTSFGRKVVGTNVQSMHPVVAKLPRVFQNDGAKRIPA